MRGLKTVLKKELSRVFKDKKMILGLFIFPPIMMIIIYGLIGKGINSAKNSIESHIPTVYVRNLDEKSKKDMDSILKNMELKEYKENELEFIKEELKNGKIDAIIDLPEGFRQNIEVYNKENIPDVKIFYNPSEDNSEVANEKLKIAFTEILKKEMIKNRVEDVKSLEIFTLNKDGGEKIFEQNKMSGKFLSAMLPYFVVMMLFSSIMGLGTDMFAGEKERGTMAAMLLSPVKRTDIVLGKLFALTIVAIVSSVAYVAALSYVIPKSMSMGENDAAFSFSISQVGIILIIMLSLAFFMVSIVSVISTYAKNIKEASTYIMPVYFLVIAGGVMTMFGNENISSLRYLIPVYGSSLAIGKSLVGELKNIELIYTVLSSVGFGIVFSFVTAKMFENEKIMFNA